MTVTDIIDQQNQFKAHTWEITLWPQAWAAFPGSHELSWSICRLGDAERGTIPEESGIYTLLVQPGIAEHIACSYLMYVGQTVSLKDRFGRYLTTERRAAGRPKIFRLLNIYSEYVWFCYTVLDKVFLDAVENELMKAYYPPCNDQYPVEVSKVIGAF